MNKTEAARKIGSGQWFEGDLDEMLEGAQEDWDAAPSTGQWSTTIDVADLTKILTELRERRSQDA